MQYLWHKFIGRSPFSHVLALYELVHMWDEHGTVAMSHQTSVSPARGKQWGKDIDITLSFFSLLYTQSCACQHRLVKMLRLVLKWPVGLRSINQEEMKNAKKPRIQSSKSLATEHPRSAVCFLDPCSHIPMAWVAASVSKCHLCHGSECRQAPGFGRRRGLRWEWDRMHDESWISDQ